MGQQDSIRQVGRRILRLASGCDASDLTLSSLEGFLLSRIDGRTPWRLLREMGGMSSEETDLCLEGWLASGYVEVAEHEVVGSREGLPPLPSIPGNQETEGLRLDPALDLTLDMQRRILQLESRVGGPDRVLLGVAEEADGRCIKRAYLKISREFHPDRYFRRDLGPYRSKLEGIFRQIQRAYENLSHVTSGEFSEVEAEQNCVSSPDVSKTPNSERRLVRGPQTKATHSGVSGSNRRMPHHLPEHVRHEREQKARQLMRGAHQAISEGRLREAATCVEIVIRFDPANRAAREVLADLRTKLDGEGEGPAGQSAPVVSMAAARGLQEMGDLNFLSSKLDE